MNESTIVHGKCTVCCKDVPWWTPYPRQRHQGCLQPASGWNHPTVALASSGLREIRNEKRISGVKLG